MNIAEQIQAEFPDESREVVTLLHGMLQQDVEGGLTFRLNGTFTFNNALDAGAIQLAVIFQDESAFTRTFDIQDADLSFNPLPKEPLKDGWYWFECGVYDDPYIFEVDDNQYYDARADCYSDIPRDWKYNGPIKEPKQSDLPTDSTR